MRRTAGFLLVMILLAAGCMDPPTLPDEAASKSAIHRPETHSAPVTADQVNESNAYDKAEALELELSQDAAEGNHPKTNSAQQ